MFENILNQINKINKDNSTSILKGIQSLMILGNSIFKSLEIQREIEEGKNKRIIEQAITLVSKRNYKVEQALLQTNIISEEEKLILSYSKDTKVSIDYIIELRELSKNFNKTLLRLSLPIIIALYIGFLIINTVLEMMKKPVDELLEIVKITKGIDMSNSLNIPDIFFYIYHPEIYNYFIIIFSILLLLSIFLFFYYEKNDPSKLYKILPLKAYDDIPYVFILMKSLNASGMDMYGISKQLANSKINPGWKKLFSRIQKRIENNLLFYQSFKDFNFSKQIYIVIKVSEVSKSLWDNFDRTVTFSKKINIDKNSELIRRYGSLSALLGFTIFIYFLMGVFFLMLSTQKIATALQ